MRLVAGVYERTLVHRIDAHEHAEEVGALRNLKHSRLPGRAFPFDPELARAGENLPCDQKWQNARDELVPRDIAPHQVIVVAPIAMPGEVGVVLVQAHLVVWREFQISPARALSQNPLAGFLMADQLPQGRAFGGRVFRVGVIVIKPRAIRENQIAFDFFETKRPILIDFVVGRLIRVLKQLGRAKTTGITMWIFQGIIPFHVRAVFGVRADQLNRLGYDIHGLSALNRDPVFRFRPEHSRHRGLSYFTPPGSETDSRVLSSGDDPVNLD